MATFKMDSPSHGELAADVYDEEENAAELLANALKKMDGLIGDYKEPSPPPDDPLTTSIVTQCEALMSLMVECEERGGEGRDPRDSIPAETREELIGWLGKKRPGTPLASDQLQRDKQELLKQVVSLSEELETAKEEAGSLRGKVAELERRLGGREQQCKALAEELKAARATIQAKEVELKQLQDEVQARIRRGSSITKQKPHKHVTLVHANIIQPEPRRSGSFRKSLSKKFGRKKTHTATLPPPAAEDASAPEPLNPRAAAFHAMNGHQLGQWFHGIGLDMYSDLVEQVPSGEKLVAMVSKDSNTELIKIGIVSTLHCKKLRLAIEEAVNEQPSPLEGLNFNWVADWLKDIGLSQYYRMFHDARIDGRMLNLISLEDLNLLDLTTPFHLISLKRAIQALRMCGYNPNYLKEPAMDKGSQKLLHWSAQDVADWVRSIELDEYVSGLEDSGIHGAVMLLEVHFTSESLARALGIAPTKQLIRKHLSKKFMEVLGPIAAQKKVDAMQVKSFVALDPTEQPKFGHRSRSRSTGSRRRQSQREEELLCPLSEFPATEAVFSGQAAAAFSPLTLTDIQEMDYPQTP